MDVSSLSWLVLPQMLALSESLYQEVQEKREKRKHEKGSTQDSKKDKGKTKPLKERAPR